MAKLLDAPITASDLDDYLATQDSFALELRVLKFASGLGFIAQHGGSYIDPVLAKHRQFDLRLRKVMGARSISMAIECKSLQKSCPLLVSRIPRHPNESFHFRVYVQHRDGHHFPNVVRSDSARVFYAADEMVGKSLAQVGKTVNGSWTDSDADLHDKWTQALNSSVELFEAEMRLPFHEVAFAAVVPCLVVSDDTLWTVDYESDGSIKGPPEPADEVTYFVGRAYSTFNPVAEFTISHLHIFTERGMRNRLTELEKGCPWWTTLT